MARSEETEGPVWDITKKGRLRVHVPASDVDTVVTVDIGEVVVELENEGFEVVDVDEE